MQKSLLKEIIIEQQERVSKLEAGVPREALQKAAEFLSLPHVLVIAGIRRVGKSILLYQIADRFYQGKYYYFNFEDERLIKFASDDFNNLYELLIELFGERKVFFFDEIQNIKGWENFVRRMQDNGNKFFVTGSNASLLSKELGTKLTGRHIGRHISLSLYPFSFREFLIFKNYQLSEKSLFQTKERAKIIRFFHEYLFHGGMPEYLIYKTPDILRGIYEDILYRDIVARYEIKEVKALRELSLYYLSNVANLISFNQIKKFLKLGSVNTVKSYTAYLENSFLFFTMNLFSYSLKQQLIAPKKIYCVDNGFVAAAAFKFSQDRGRLLENMVFLELKRRGKEVFYYKTANNLEIDFAIKNGGKITDIIQVTENLNAPETKEREIKSIIRALDELSLKKAIILTFDEEDVLKFKNKTIYIQPVYKWLLNIDNLGII